MRVINFVLTEEQARDLVSAADDGTAHASPRVGPEFEAMAIIQGVLDGSNGLQLWQVTNGYSGDGAVTALVYAAGEEQAVERGREALRHEEQKRVERATYRTGGTRAVYVTPPMRESFYDGSLKAEVLEVPCVVEIS